MANKGVWILTYEVNDHNQHGEYFSKVFEKKPTIAQLAPHVSDVLSGDMGEAIAQVQHILDGKGRINAEHTWYNLAYVEFSK